MKQESCVTLGHDVYQGGNKVKQTVNEGETIEEGSKKERQLRRDKEKSQTSKTVDEGYTKRKEVEKGETRRPW